MALYHPVLWHDFFVATVGATAALTGLLFVSLSLNLTQILRYPGLQGRAAGTLAMLVSVLVVCTFGLTADVGRRPYGVETLVVGTAAAAQALWFTLRNRAADQRAGWLLLHLLLLLLSALAFVGGGISLLAAAGGGMYWVLAAVVIAIVSAAVNAWVLLVEILR